MPLRTTRLDRIADWAMQPRSSAFMIALVVGGCAAATLLRAALDPYLPDGFPFITYFPAVAVTAVVAGTWPAIAAAVISGLLSWYLFIPPSRSFALDTHVAFGIALYVMVVGIEIVLVVLTRHAMRRLALARAQATESARAQALMFAELQHRVSNNLGVVSSLLTLQRRTVTDPQARRALEDAARRIGIVARLNRLLHNPDAQNVDLAAFLRAMVPEAVAAAAAESRIRVEVTAEPVMVSAETAVPIGLIATELLSNAIEHGYPNDKSGHIAIALTHEENGGAAITIRDDGVGLPDGFLLEDHPSLGLMIARQFAQQLGARLSVLGGGGVVSRVEFPLVPAA